MNPPPPDDLSSLSMLELFRLEAETQAAQLTSGLLELESQPSPESFEKLMRAAHSLKGAARIVNLQPAVRIAHAMEDCFAAAQRGALRLRQPEIDLLLQGVDLLVSLAKCPEPDTASWESEHAAEIARFVESLAQLPALNRSAAPILAPSPAQPPPAGAPENAHDAASPLENCPLSSAAAPSPHLANSLSRSAPLDLSSQTPAIRKPTLSQERLLHLTADTLNGLLALAGESLAESRWLRPFCDSLQRLKHHHLDLNQKLEHLRQALGQEQLSEPARNLFDELFRELAEARQYLAERTQELDLFDRRSAHLTQRLYLEVLRTRMRPFSDCVRRFPRMVRDISRPLGKTVKLEILGENTQVDRDILEQLETPLAHLLRNAVDHGCEMPELRRRAGKPPEGTIRLEARHRAGVLLLTVADDGPGVDLERVRSVIIQKQLAPPAAASKFTETELLDFLFLPGFTLKETVTELSGRGFGLDIVQNMVESLRGSVRLANHPGHGLRVQLQLPLTLSVLRALLVEAGGQPDASPHTQLTPRPKRILLADDSLTARELERKLLAGRGFQVDLAVDGQDAWNSLLAEHYDLLITDVDMPRMDGITLASRIKKDPHLKSLPVLIISYKDGEADRLRGLETGADYYVTKGTLDDETLVEAVIDLIGEPAVGESQ